MEYSKLIEELYALRDEGFALFQRRIVNPRAQKIIGVRTPILRQLVKKYKGEYQTLLSFSEEYYEVAFIKLNAVALLPYEKFITVVGFCVQSIENWAICDTFKARCIQKHREEFLPYIYQFLRREEFEQRYALVTLLSFYVEEKYLFVIFDCIKTANRMPYYTYMAAAWLLAEVLIKHYPAGVAFLKQNLLDKRTHNKAIQKARESYRLSREQKEELLALKQK